MTDAQQRICVFCGSRPGNRPEYEGAGRELGRAIAERGAALVYGGASVGVMGQVADATMSAGGRAIGVIPRTLVDREVAHHGLSELHVVDTMHERKALMERLSDGFVVLPGGYGTLDELFEILTWAHLGIHRKPVGLVNTAGFWDPLLSLIDHLVREGFVTGDMRGYLVVDREPRALLGKMQERASAPGPVTERRSSSA